MAGQGTAALASSAGLPKLPFKLYDRGTKLFFCVQGTAFAAGLITCMSTKAALQPGCALSFDAADCKFMIPCHQSHSDLPQAAAASAAGCTARLLNSLLLLLGRTMSRLCSSRVTTEMLSSEPSF